MRIRRSQDERKSNDLLAEQREGRHAVAGLPKILHQSELGIGIRAQQAVVHLEVLHRCFEVAVCQPLIGRAQECHRLHGARIPGIFGEWRRDEMRLLGRRRDRPALRHGARRAFALADRFPARRHLDRQRIGHHCVPDPRHPIGRARQISTSCFDQARRFAESTRVLAARLLHRVVDDTLVVELAGQFLSGRCTIDPIDVDRDLEGGVVIVAVHARAGAVHPRIDRGQLQSAGHGLHGEIGVQ